MLFTKPQQWRIFLAVGIFLIAWYTFTITTPGTITFEDGGELATEPYILGSAHPSGQPIFTILGKITTFVPLGPIVWRTNLYSSLASALALVFLFLVYLQLSAEIDQGKNTEFHYVRLITGVCVCLLTTFSLDYWLQSILTEVYALNALFFILAVYLALCYHETGDLSYIYLLSLSLGLSMGNHHTTIFLLPALIYLVLYKNWRLLLNLKALLIIIGLAAIGLTVYLELPLRSAQNTLVNWGDPQTWPRFLGSFFRHQYRPITIERTGGIFLNQLSFFGFSIQQTAFWIWLSLVGMIYLAYRLSRKAIFVFTLFVFYTIGFVYLINPETPYQMPFLLRTFYLPAYMLLAIMTGMGLLALMEFVHWLDQRFDWQLQEMLLYFSLLLLLIPAFPARANYKDASRRYYYYTHDYVNNMLKSTKRDSILFTLYAQDTFPLWYSQFVEGKRPDVLVVHQRLYVNEWFRKMAKNYHPAANIPIKAVLSEQMVGYYAFADNLQKDLIAANPERPVFASQYCRLFGKNYRLKKEGTVFRFLSPDDNNKGDYDPRRFYFYRGFDRETRYFQMDARAIEIAQSSYL